MQNQSSTRAFVPRNTGRVVNVSTLYRPTETKKRTLSQMAAKVRQDKVDGTFDREVASLIEASMKRHQGTTVRLLAGETAYKHTRAARKAIKKLEKQKRKSAIETAKIVNSKRAKNKRRFHAQENETTGG